MPQDRAKGEPRKKEEALAAPSCLLPKQEDYIEAELATTEVASVKQELAPAAKAPMVTEGDAGG